MGTSAEVGFHTVIRWVICTRTHQNETAHPQLHLCFEPLFRNCTDTTNFANVYKGTVCVCVRACMCKNQDSFICLLVSVHLCMSQLAYLVIAEVG